MKTLYPFQQEDVDFLSPMSSGAIFNEPQTGKTLIAINVYRNWIKTNPRPLLVICPNVAISHWKSEILDQIPNAKILTQSDLKKTATKTSVQIDPNNTYLILSYAYLNFNWKKLAGKWHVILDEAHSIKNSDSLRTNTILKNINPLFDQKLILTGTPVTNNAFEIFNLLHFIRPKEFPFKHQFGNMWFQSTYNHFKYKALPANFKRNNPTKAMEYAREYKAIRKGYEQAFIDMLKKFSVQRKRIELEACMTEPIVERVLIEPDQSCIKAEKGIRQNLLGYEMPNKEKVNMYLHQGISIIGWLTFRKVYDWGDAYYGLHNSKTEWIKEFAETKLPNDKFIVFSESKVYINFLQTYLQKNLPSQKIGIITGDNIKERDQIVKDFQDGNIDVLCISRKAGSESISLSRAKSIVFADLPFTPADLIQASARANAKNPSMEDNQKFIYHLFPDNLVGRWMSNLIQRKEDITKFINDWRVLEDLLKGEN